MKKPRLGLGVGGNRQQELLQRGRNLGPHLPRYRQAEPIFRLEKDEVVELCRTVNAPVGIVNKSGKEWIVGIVGLVHAQNRLVVVVGFSSLACKEALGGEHVDIDLVAFQLYLANILLLVRFSQVLGQLTSSAAPSGVVGAGFVISEE